MNNQQNSVNEMKIHKYTHTHTDNKAAFVWYGIKGFTCLIACTSAITY